MLKMVFEDVGLGGLSSRGIHLWKDLFICVKLNEIMQQKDDLAFAELLNRARVGRLVAEDIEVLKSRVIGEGDNSWLDSLHVFATNAECMLTIRKCLML